jgi:hypothetical protein
MLQSSRGSASVLCMFVVLPFLFILLVVGIEVSQFLGVREEIQRLIDSEAKISLGRGYRSEDVSRRIASRAEGLKPYVSLERIESNQTPQQDTIRVEGGYDGLFAQLVGSLIGGGSAAIPFELSTSVRRTHTAALILLDRAVNVGSDRCRDENLSRREVFVARLVKDFQSFGVENVQVGVMPGVNREIDILSSTDDVPRCGGADSTSPLRITSVEGVDEGVAVDTVSIAYRAVQMLFSRAIPARTEQRAVIMVAPPSEPRTEVISNTFSLLETEAAQQSIKISAVGIVIGGPANKEFFGVRNEAGRATYLHLSEDEALNSDARVALMHHIQGHIFVAR